MVYLVDTNILLRIMHRNDPRHAMVRRVVRTLRTNGHDLHTTPQNFVEFWNAATRPTNRNGFGLTPPATDRLLGIAERIFPVLPDSPNIYSEWRRIVVDYSVSGVQAHDARIVASMIVHGVTHILTLNTSDFVRYAPEGIVTVDPVAV